MSDTAARRCYVCRSADTAIGLCVERSDGSNADVLVCRDCGHAICAEEPGFDALLKKQVERFDEVAERPRQSLPWQHRLMRLRARVERIVGSSGKILDIGCGPGQWLAVLGDRWEKYGVEAAPVAADLARQAIGADVYCGPFENYQAEAGPFDVITSFAVVEHLKDPRKLIEWSYDHLRPGGLLVLMTGDRESKMARRFGRDWPLYKPSEHLHFFSGRSLERLVTDSGFVVGYREWRSSKYGLKSKISAYSAALRDVLRLLGQPSYDHLYLYALKPSG